jgi:SHS2 domain-containing protein
VVKSYEILNHTADIGIIAYGKDLKELFTNAGKGLLSLVIDPEEIRVKVKRDIEVNAPDRETLLVNWLDELIFIMDTKELLLKDFKVTNISENTLKVEASGEKIKKSKHHLKREVKAATYHHLKIEQSEKIWRAQIIFDI